MLVEETESGREKKTEKEREREREKERERKKERNGASFVVTPISNNSGSKQYMIVTT